MQTIGESKFPRHSLCNIAKANAERPFLDDARTNNAAGGIHRDAHYNLTLNVLPL